MSDSATLTPAAAAHGEHDHDHEPIQLTRQQVYLTPGKLDLLQRFAIALCGAGAIMTLINCVAVGLQQTMFSYLFAFYFVLTVSLGGLFWTQIHHLTAAGWSTGIRRTYENFIRVLLVMGLLFIPIWLCLTQLYEWAAIHSAGETANNPNLRGGKGFYLSWPFFTVRVLLYFGVWGFFGYKFLKMSQEQDQSGDPELSRKMAGLSAPATLLLGVTATFAGFDLVMSLDYAWFSTMFGVYTWAGCIRSSLATATLTVLLLRAAGHLHGVITREHMHDLGKLLFGFTVFWTYIAFSQYFLYWYGNMPEETRWFLRRQGTELNGEFVYTSWRYVGYLLPVCHFAIPFFFLMPRTIKRIPLALGIAAAWILTFHMVDVYWQIMPTYYDGGLWSRVVTGDDGKQTIEQNIAAGLLTDISALAFTVGLFLTILIYGLKTHPLVPIKDPRLEESLLHEQE